MFRVKMIMATAAATVGAEMVTEDLIQQIFANYKTSTRQEPHAWNRLACLGLLACDELLFRPAFYTPHGVGPPPADKVTIGFEVKQLYDVNELKQERDALLPMPIPQPTSAPAALYQPAPPQTLTHPDLRHCIVPCVGLATMMISGTLLGSRFPAFRDDIFFCQHRRLASVATSGCGGKIPGISPSATSCCQSCLSCLSCLSCPSCPACPSCPSCPSCPCCESCHSRRLRAVCCSAAALMLLHLPPPLLLPCGVTAAVCSRLLPDVNLLFTNDNERTQLHISHRLSCHQTQYHAGRLLTHPQACVERYTTVYTVRHSCNHCSTLLLHALLGWRGTRRRWELTSSGAPFTSPRSWLRK